MLVPPIMPPAATARYLVDAANPRRRERALEDLATGFSRWRLPAALARLDIRNRYRGSVLGPFWLSLSTAIMVVALGLLYSALFKLPLADYLPFLAVSLIIWGMISQIVSDACTSLISSEGIIRQVPLPYTVHALRCVFRNAVIAAHSLPLILVIFLIFGHMPGPEALLALPGLALLAVNAFAIALFLGMLCARFRDIPPIVANVVQLAFFMSPVIWKPGIAGRAGAMAAAQSLLHHHGDHPRAADRGRRVAAGLALGHRLHPVHLRRGLRLLRPLPRPHRLLGLSRCR
ncbi:ABC transporter permease [Siccirubricoccus sp. G192]|uniref:ABC transporter permease n=1 Tax=Siccirubricoccus sp. G192 TaxID=2849651 RepID=UPI0020C2EAEA|nr:ABC transporter permease [Siccirubricoccus sp. G192]